MLRTCWRAVPLALRVALILTVAAELCELFQFAIGSTETFLEWMVGMQGIQFAARVAIVVGTLELVQIVPLRRRFGAKLIAAGAIASFTASCLYFVAALEPSWLPSWGETVVAWGWYGSALAVGVGFAWIAWKKPVIAIVGAVVWLNANSPVSTWLYANHHAMLQHIGFVLHVLGTLSLLALAMVAVSDVPTGFVIPEPRRAKLGYRMLEHSMWWRLMATVLLILLTFMIAGARDSSAIAIAITLSSVISGVTFAWFAFGALTVARSNIVGVHRGLFVAAAFGSAWCGAVTMARLSSAYGAETFTHAFELALPVVAAVTLVLIAIGITKYAAKAGAVELAGKATRLIWLVIILQVGSSLFQYAMRRGQARDELLLFTLLLVGAGIVVIASTARVAGAAAEHVTEDVQADLPVAKLI